MSYGGELRYSFSYVTEIRSQENEEFYVGNHDVIIQAQYTYIQRSLMDVKISCCISSTLCRETGFQWVTVVRTSNKIWNMTS